MARPHLPSDRLEDSQQNHFEVKIYGIGGERVALLVLLAGDEKLESGLTILAAAWQSARQKPLIFDIDKMAIAVLFRTFYSFRVSTRTRFAPVHAPMSELIFNRKYNHTSISSPRSPLQLL